MEKLLENPVFGADEVMEPRVLRLFELTQTLGKGSYGIVWKAIDKRSRRVVALKKCYDAFRTDADAQRTYREVMYLTELASSGHDNLVRLSSIYCGQGNRSKDFYLVFDFMETDLFLVIQADGRRPFLKDMHKKYITFQILKALKFLHSADVCHRNLKPSNILMNSDCHIQLCGMGSCRSVSENRAEIPPLPPVLTDYVSFRWYRSPEVLLGSTHYSTGVDIWALGCIVAELFLHEALFKGKSTFHQIELILEVNGKPKSDDVDALGSPYASTMMESVMVTRPQSLPQMIPNASSEAVDLITQSITFSPAKRPSAETTLRHPFLAEFHDPDDEPVREEGVIQLETNDNVRLSAAEYRTKLLNEIDRRKAFLRRQEIQKLKKPSTTILTTKGIE